MTNNVSAAIGTARQFGKQPERPYNKQLNNPNFGRGINIGADQGAALLAQSLGVIGNGILNESLAMDKRDREQFTMEDAARMVAGKTPQDLEDFDRINALQHSDKGFDLTDNPYAMANLDRAIGQTASTYAREQWATDAETNQPKSVNEAVQNFNAYLQDNYQNFKKDAKNSYAFDQGFYESYQQDVLKVAHSAHQKINEEARSRGQKVCNVKMQDLLLNAGNMDTKTFSASMGAITRELQLYCKSSDEAMSIIGNNLAYLVQNETSTEKLNAVKDIKYFGDRTIGEELPMFKFYRKIADNVNAKDADDIIKAAVRPDGTIDWTLANQMIAGLKGTDPIQNGIPQVNLPVSQADNPDLKNLSPTMKKVLPSIGGLLSMMGYGDVAQITSGYRTAQHNAEVGGVPNSMHTSGNAVDIYLGDLSQAEANAVIEKFKPYFKTHLFHDAGSGKHLHLDGYIGGLDNKANDGETNAFAYDDERLKKITARLEAYDSDARRAAKQREDDLYKNTLQGVTGANSEAEAINIVQNSGLSITKQNTLIRSIKAQYKALAKGNLTAEQQYYINYEKRKLWSDIEVMNEYNRRLNSDDDADIIDDAFQRRANGAAYRLNKYWRQSQGKGDAPAQDDVQDVAPTSAEENKEDIAKEIKQVALEMKDADYPWEDIEDRILTLADKYGLDGVAICNELDGVQ